MICMMGIAFGVWWICRRFKDEEKVVSGTVRSSGATSEWLRYVTSNRRERDGVVNVVDV